MSTSHPETCGPCRECRNYFDEKDITFEDYVNGTVHPGACGPCADCKEALADYATTPAYQARLRQGAAA